MVSTQSAQHLDHIGKLKELPWEFVFITLQNFQFLSPFKLTTKKDVSSEICVRDAYLYRILSEANEQNNQTKGQILRGHLSNLTFKHWNPFSFCVQFIFKDWILSLKDNTLQHWLFTTGRTAWALQRKLEAPSVCSQWHKSHENRGTKSTCHQDPLRVCHHTLPALLTLFSTRSCPAPNDSE